jgi:DNA-binding CsgD family transcriptional regulator
MRASQGEFAAAHEAFTRAVSVAARFGDHDLLALARHGQGRTLLMMNRIAEGMALLDEVMVSVTGGELGPIVAGAVYCSVITACHDRFDVRRAQEWTTALEGWCAAQPGLVAFRGYCQIRRSELMQLHGAWPDAFAEATRACARLSDPPRQPEAGAAHYQLAELHRLRGAFDHAEEGYRLAHQAGRKPQPGLALLRLAQGQLDAAVASIRLALQEARDLHPRVSMLAAAVEILLAANDTAAARAAADELAALAGPLDLPFLRAVSAYAAGAVALAEGDAAGALESLRTAWRTWQELDAPFDLASTRVLLGRAYRMLGDRDGAQLEFDAAHEAFEQLGAAPALARIAALTAAAPASPATSTDLTGREIEVLRLVATGVTNRVIAARLDISEKTVARHVSNIFTKLDLPSRAAATAYAYEHKLV